MNEFLFFFQVFLVIFFTLGALKLGKEALIASLCLQAVMANLFVTKQIELFSLHVTCSDGFAIGSLLSLNLIQEYYGKKTAGKAVIIAFFSMLFFAVASSLHLQFAPLESDTFHLSFIKILSPTPRLLFASLITFFIVGQCDIVLYSFVKRVLSKWQLGARNALSLSVSQCIDTALFSVLGLWGLVDSIFHIFILSYMIKLIFIFSSSSLLLLIKKRESNELYV